AEPREAGAGGVAEQEADPAALAGERPGGHRSLAELDAVLVDLDGAVGEGASAELVTGGEGGCPGSAAPRPALSRSVGVEHHPRQGGGVGDLDGAGGPARALDLEQEVVLGGGGGERVEAHEGFLIGIEDRGAPDGVGAG